MDGERKEGGWGKRIIEDLDGGIGYRKLRMKTKCSWAEEGLDRRPPDN